MHAESIVREVTDGTTWMHGHPAQDERAQAARESSRGLDERHLACRRECAALLRGEAPPLPEGTAVVVGRSWFD